MDRPALQRLLFDARNKQFDLILVYKQDRLSRRLKDLLGLLEEIDSLGIITILGFLQGKADGFIINLFPTFQNLHEDHL